MGEVVVAISGASGAIYGKRLLEILDEKDIPSRLVVTSAGELTLKHECGITKEELAKQTNSILEDEGNVGGKSTSGSSKIDAVVICPCSGTTIGKIAAGTPVEAIQNEVSRIPLPNNLEKNGDYFGLKVQGDSMIDAGIHEGDTVIIKRTDTADNGKIVVALIDEHEAMLKRIRKKGKVVALESANRNYETKIFGPDRVKVQGVLVSLYRNF